MPWVEVTNRYEHVDTPSTHTIADELHSRNKTDSATSWLSEWCVPSVNRANDSESLFFFLFFFFFSFSIQPSKQSYRDRDEASIYHCRVRTKISHILCSVLRQVSLSSQCLASSRSWNGYRRTDRKTSRNTEQGVGWGEWGRNMSRTSIPARGRIAILLVTSRCRNKNRLLLDRHLGSSTDLSLYALNKK